MVKILYPRIGVTPHPLGDDPIIALDLDNEPDVGYFKFQTLEPEPETATADNAQADQFEAWLNEKKLGYTRGRDEETDTPARYFDLPQETVNVLKSLGFKSTY